VLSGDVWLPNPAIVAAAWALAANGVLTRLAASVTVHAPIFLERAARCTSSDMDGALAAALVLFLVKLLACYSGFQYLDAISAVWRVLLRIDANNDLGLLLLQALTVVGVATLYITWQGPIAGVKIANKSLAITREEAEKAFHDTTIGQAIGVSFAPVFEILFELVCWGGGRLAVAELAVPEDLRENAVLLRLAPDGGAAAKDRGSVQVMEFGAGVLYVVFLVTPLSCWLYYAFVLTDAERKMESQNAAAAADDGSSGAIDADGGSGDMGGGFDGGAD